VFEIGNSLREARLRQQLELPEIEQQTKIRAKYLNALEDEQFEQLPAPTYVKGFLRNYADALGLDGQLYVDEYNSRFVTGEEDVPLRPRDYQRRPSHSFGPRFEMRGILLALGAIGIVFALVIAAWKFGSPSNEKVPGTNARPTVPVGTTAAKKRRHKPAAPALAHVVLTATSGNCWLEVRAGSAAGPSLYTGTLQQGQQLPFTHGRYLRPRLWIAAGAPWNLVARVNGRVRAIPQTSGGKPTNLIVTAKSITKAPRTV
jgi:cytoskeleton protein RodZ